MTFQDDLAADMTAVFLNTDEFGEAVRYWPKEGVSRSITAVVDRGRRQSTPGEHHRINEDTLRLTSSASATAGINNPQLGDLLQLTEDAETEGWAFVAVEHRDSHCMVTQWTKKTLQKSGFPRGLTP